MDIDETDRYHLFDWFETHMGPDLAPTMIKSLPPVNWTEVATRDDLANLGTTLRGEMHAMEARLTEQNAQNLRTLFFGMVGTNATLVGLIFAAVRLAEG